MKAKKAKAVSYPSPFRIDIGCGPRKRDGFYGVDIRAIDGVDEVVDIRGEWPWPNNSVDEVHSSHFLEHLDGTERIHFFNELYRVMKPGALASIITPDWSHDCAYGDPTHKWPPLSRWYPLYLFKEWRDREAPHVGYKCDFDYVVGGSTDPVLETKNMEYRMFATQFYNNSLRDLCVTLTKRA